MPEFHWTSDQLRAIETVDRDVLVSAAAGSGKTAVLAERCAYLVTKAPSPYRCNVDELLVLTFTDAAAAEMRSRIHHSLRQRAVQAPQDVRLLAQVELVDTAQISTIHAFCMTIVRRWFNRAGVDVIAPMLGEDEGKLLRLESIDAVFEREYANNDDPVPGFDELIEDYGLGSDKAIKQFVLDVAQFLESIPDPDAWLDHAGDFSDARVNGVVAQITGSLRNELRRQWSLCQAMVADLPTEWRACAFYREKIVAYQEQLDTWGAALSSVASFDSIRDEIDAYALSSKGVPITAKDAAPDEKDAKDQGSDAFKFVKERLFTKRLKSRFCQFTTDELRQGMIDTQPYVATLIELVRRYRQQYQSSKRAIGVMDFSDLERISYELLTTKLDGESENPVVTQLRGRFAHVLVDEFQDINPLQAKILSLVSRFATEDSHGNLFTVGDVKQSIYRFRLAEPNMFLKRSQKLIDDPKLGERIDLQQNYRSTKTILEGVNLLFGALMSAACGGIEYDHAARLKSPDANARGEPIELHILEREIGTETDDEGGDSEFVDWDDPEHWSVIEREARLVGGRIQELLGRDLRVDNGDDERPLCFSDFCVLLRSAKHTARAVAAVFERMGIPCWAQKPPDAFDRLEIRETLALLSIIDNVRQDIPLAAVLRSGILGIRLTEDELVAIRTTDRRVAFHEAVVRYAKLGRDLNLREKVSGVLAKVKRYRQQLYEQPLADVLWSIYRETGYMSFVCGLTDEALRRKNLLHLHDRARRFGDFRRQGLRRFLQYIEQLQTRGEALEGNDDRAADVNAVSICSIHHSKGLEYPVVIVMDAAREFNLTDASGRVLFERNLGIGLRRVERERLIEYPTALQKLCATAAEEAALAEELRVWYVATTRAKQKLILVGTAKLDKLALQSKGRSTSAGALDPITILSAKCPLDWILTTLAHDTNYRVRWPSDQPSGAQLFEVSTYDSNAIANLRIDSADDSKEMELCDRIARLEPLPDWEPVSQQPTQSERVLGRLEFKYPNLAACSIGAVRSASEKDQSFAEVVGESADGWMPVRDSTIRSANGDGSDSALVRGTAVHAFLQNLDLNKTSSSQELRIEIERLEREGMLTSEQAEHIEPEQIAWLFETSLGERIREAADNYYREWMFLSLESLHYFDRLIDADASDRILVRGVVDGILDDGDALEIVDYKTDRIADDQVETRSRLYVRQLGLYASAAEAVFGLSVRKAHLAFLTPRKMVSFTGEQIKAALSGSE